MNDAGAAARRTPESRLLDQHPGVRELIESLPEFITWRGTLPVVVVDHESFYVFGGDQLREDDQIIVEWVRQRKPELLEGDRRGGPGPVR